MEQSKSEKGKNRKLKAINTLSDPGNSVNWLFYADDPGELVLTKEEDGDEAFARKIQEGDIVIVISSKHTLRAQEVIEENGNGNLTYKCTLQADSPMLAELGSIKPCASGYRWKRVKSAYHSLWCRRQEEKEATGVEETMTEACARLLEGWERTVQKSSKLFPYTQ